MNSCPTITNKKLLLICAQWSQSPTRPEVARAREIFLKHDATSLVEQHNFLMAAAIVSTPCLANFNGTLRTALADCKLSHLIVFELPAKWEWQNTHNLAAQKFPDNQQEV
jgi:hypothetical protein